MIHKFILFSIYLALLLDLSSAECRSGDFSCANDKCIPFTWRCDKEDDCGDNSDEKNCDRAGCRFGEFSCNNDKCIPIKWRCDKEDDCGDWSDEEDCGVPVCSPGEISCKNGRCINATLRCNTENDCGDNSDEEKCDVAVCTAGHFACSNGQCIPLPCECDGDFDCTDKSDEDNCTSTIKRTCDKETEFECGNNTCIPIGLVCNKKNDCGDSEDEPSDKCFVNECLLNNGGCPQLCVDDNYGFHCECHDGYKLSDDGSCILKRESLLYKNGSDLLILDIETGIKKTVFSGLGKPIALDYDFENNVIMWGDTLNKSIHRLTIQNGTNLFAANGSNVDTVVIDKVNPEGLAVDWIYGNVYWTDAIEESINVATLDGNLTRVLFKSNISKPRAIVVNPLEGWLFWTDWGRNPKIERAGMDGTHRSIIISENMTWPNGLAIDYETRRLFWTDAKQHSLSSSDYDGSNVKEIVSSRSVVGHAFSIDVFQDSLYWNEWLTKSIKRVNKITGKNYEIVVNKIHVPSGLKVYHPLKQPKGINYCINTNSSCSHFCLPAPQVTVESLKFTCFCPAGMILAHDKRICTAVTVE